MKVRSKAQLEKLQELVKQGSMTQEDFLRKTQGVDPKKLPDRISTETKKEVKKASHHKRAW